MKLPVIGTGEPLGVLELRTARSKTGPVSRRSPELSVTRIHERAKTGCPRSWAPIR